MFNKNKTKQKHPKYDESTEFCVNLTSIIFGGSTRVETVVIILVSGKYPRYIHVPGTNQ